MRKVLLVLGLSGLAFAGESFVDVPITINNTGGCVFENMPSVIDFGSVPWSAYQGNSTYNLTPFQISVKCTNGINYSVSLASGWYGANNYVRLTQGSNAVRLTFFRDSAYTQQITNQNRVITSGTGNGNTQTITVYPRLAGCDNFGSCPAGTYSGTVTLRITY